MPTVNSLPQFVTPFIGQTDEVGEISGLLDDPACRLLTLIGPGGTGKTRLAVQVTAQKSADFSHGVYFVPLAPLSSADQIVPTIASTIGMLLSGDDTPARQLFNYLHGKRLLLILDNFEHLLDGVPLVTELLEAAPELKLLVTSWEALNLQEEWVRQVKGMRFPGSDDPSLEHIAHYSAVRLFVDRARRTRSDFTLAAEAPHVIRVCRLVEGFPLGIELATAWLKTLACVQVADEIQRDMDFLTSPLRNVPERHRSIRAVFDHS